ncbi:MAG: metal-dependent hydrolase [Candidatus Pacearchaeota archaeon]
MLFRTHILFSVILLLVLLPFFNINLLFILFFIFGVLFPDIDNKKSKLGKIFIFRPLQWIFKHRTTFHSVFLIGTISLILELTNKGTGIGFFLGSFSHLFLDMMTTRGVPIFFPFSNLRIKGFIRTGKNGEKTLFFMLLIFLIILILKYFRV